MEIDLTKYDKGNGQPWCSPHQCHPSKCFLEHNPKAAVIPEEPLHSIEPMFPSAKELQQMAKQRQRIEERIRAKSQGK